MATNLIAFDAETRIITAELPYTSFNFSLPISGKGSWTATLPMSAKDPSGIELLTTSAFDVNRTQIAFVRNGIPLFVGLVGQEQDVIDESAEHVTIGGPDGVLGPLERLVLWGTRSFTATDQLTIAKAFVDDFYPFYFQQFGIVTQIPALSGVLRDRLYYASSRITGLKAIEDLSALENGFEYLSLLTGTQATGFVPTLRLQYPQVRRQTSLVLELGRNVIKLVRDVDGSNQANAWTVLGQGQGSDVYVGANAFNNASLSTYPELDGTESRPTITTNSTAQLYANRNAFLYGYPLTSYTLTVDPNDIDCAPGAWRLGDEARLVAKRGRVNVDATYRIMSYTFAGDTSGNEVLTMSVRPADLT